MALIVTVIAAIAEGVFFTWLGCWKLHIPLTLTSSGSVAYWLIPILGIFITIRFCFSLFSRYNFHRVFIFIPILLYFFVLIIGGCFSSALFNASRYAGQFKMPGGAEFKEQDLPPFDPAQLPWISERQAVVLGDKLLGQLGAIGSSVAVKDYTCQEVRGKLYWIAPILHKNFWTYNANKGGTPGFVMVSMTNNDDVALITQLNGKDLKLKVQPEGHAAWGDKLQRIVYNYDPGALTGPYAFEIDDDLRPHWIIPVYKNTIGWGGKEVISIITVDAASGELNKYALDEIPEWIDRVQPMEFIETQLANWGKYRGGYWNRIFGKIGLLQSDPGNALVYRNGDCYLFDSLTSYEGADEATVGFVLVKMRTKDVQYFNLAGATEDAAKASALGDERVRHLRYTPNFPLPTMIEGLPTYFFGLEDPGSNITKMFALVNIAKHQTVGIGNTIQAAKTDYLTKLRLSGQTSLYTPQADLFEITGRLLRWGQYFRNGETYYSFIVDGARDRILVSGGEALEAPITQTGDRVSVKAMRTDENLWGVVSFDNLEFDQAPPELP